MIQIDMILTLLLCMRINFVRPADKMAAHRSTLLARTLGSISSRRLSTSVSVKLLYGEGTRYMYLNLPMLSFLGHRTISSFKYYNL